MLLLQLLAESLGGELLQTAVEGGDDVASILGNAVAAVVDTCPEAVGYALLDRYAVSAGKHLVVYTLDTRTVANLVGLG